MSRKMKFCSNRKNDTQIYLMHPEEERPFQGVFLYSHLWAHSHINMKKGNDTSGLTPI